MPADPSPAPMVPLDLLDRLLDAVADVLHDRPVQDLVAGKLLIETARATGADELFERGLAAVDNAGQRSRDVMWALQPAVVRHDHVEEDLADLVSRADPAEVAVRLDTTPDPAALGPLVAAVHAVLVDVLFGRGQTHRVSLSGDRDGLHAKVVADHGVAGRDGPWLQLAAARLRVAGGRMGSTLRGTTTVTDLAVPLPVEGSSGPCAQRPSA